MATVSVSNFLSHLFAASHLRRIRELEAHLDMSAADIQKLRRELDDARQCIAHLKGRLS